MNIVPLPWADLNACSIIRAAADGGNRRENTALWAGKERSDEAPRSSALRHDIGSQPVKSENFASVWVIVHGTHEGSHISARSVGWR